MGGLYASEDFLDYDDLYCEECGDSDTYIGVANNAKEARKLLGNDGYAKEFIKKTFSTEKAELPVVMNRYKIKPTTTIEDIKSASFRDGGSWIDKDCTLFKTIPLIGEIELNVGFSTVDNWDDFKHVLVLDDDFGQPYTPFYGDNYGRQINDFTFLQKVIRRYNEEMDKLDFLERIV